MPTPVPPRAPLRACPRCGFLTRERGRCPGCGAAPGGPAYAERFKALGRSLPQARVTFGLLAACGAMFLVSNMMGAYHAVREGGATPLGVLGALGRAFLSGRYMADFGTSNSVFVLTLGEYWRWLTACFLHIGVLHILFNGMALADLGRLCEAFWGRRRFWVAFVLSGVGGNAFSFAWNVLRPYAWDRWMRGAVETGTSVVAYSLEHGAIHNAAGASGAVCGLVGLLLAAWVRKRGLPDHVGRGLVRMVVYLAAFGFLIPYIDNAGHVGGGLTGFALGWWLKPAMGTRRGSSVDRAWSVAAWAVAALFVFSFAAMAHAKPWREKEHLQKADEAYRAGDPVAYWREMGRVWEEGRRQAPARQPPREAAPEAEGGP